MVTKVDTRWTKLKNIFLTKRKTDALEKLKKTPSNCHNYNYIHSHFFNLLKNNNKKDENENHKLKKRIAHYYVGIAGISMCINKLVWAKKSAQVAKRNKAINMTISMH